MRKVGGQATGRDTRRYDARSWYRRSGRGLWGGWNRARGIGMSLESVLGHSHLTIFFPSSISTIDVSPGDPSSFAIHVTANSNAKIQIRPFCDSYAVFCPARI